MNQLFQVFFKDGSSTYIHAKSFDQVEKKFGTDSIKSIHVMEVWVRGKVQEG